MQSLVFAEVAHAKCKTLTAITLTNVVLPEYCSPTRVNSISSFQKSDLNQSRRRLMSANIVTLDLTDLWWFSAVCNVFHHQNRNVVFGRNWPLSYDCETFANSTCVQAGRGCVTFAQLWSGHGKSNLSQLKGSESSL